MKTYFAVFFFSSILTLTAQASEASLPVQDYTVQFSQAASALVGTESITEDGVRSYRGQDRLGQSCLVSVQYSAHDLIVEIKNKSGVTTGAQVPASSSEITGIEINSDESTLGLQIQAGAATHSLHAEFDDANRGAGRLSSVFVSRSEAGAETAADCARLQPLL